MLKAFNIFAVAVAAALLGTALRADFTLFDMAKDSMYITKGEFTGLQRTGVGDRLTLRCDTMIKGALPVGTEVTLEAFEPAPADAALGRDVIVGFNLINGKHYFLHHPFAQRGAFYFETDDTAPNGLEQTERALRNLLVINEPRLPLIVAELQKRLQYEDAGYEGSFPADLIQAWRSELILQASWKNTWAARDAAKALVDHKLFKGTCSVEEICMIGALVANSEVGSITRAYMLELIRTESSAHPSMNVLVGMVREEVSQACVGKLSNLLKVCQDRPAVLAAMGELISNSNSSVQMRCNGLQILQALRDVNGLVHVHAAIRAEMARGADNSKPVLRRAFDAMRSTPDTSNAKVIEDFQATEICTASWEMTQYSWVAYAMIDTTGSNVKIAQMFTSEKNEARKNFFNKLMPQNKVYRELLIIHPES